jgi:hypothetical protein
MKIWLDDIRPAPEGWIHCFTVSGTIAALVVHEQVEEISLDNDLGPDTEEGYHVIRWIEQRVVESDYIPPVVNIHTANPAAARRMWSALEQIQQRLDEKGVGKNILGESHS